MAIITTSSWSSATNQSLATAEATACTSMCSAVDAAIKKMCWPYQFESSTVTGVCDAPNGNVLYLPVYPIRTLTSLYLNFGANGDTSQFTSDYLLTAYTDYYMPIDQPDGISRWGKVYRRGSGGWGLERRTAIDRLAPTVDPCRGAIYYTVAAGHTSVPADVFTAAVMAVSLLMKRKVAGAPATSSSWNGYSESLASQFLATAAIESPDVIGFLSKYLPINCAGA